jgi:hypothetical protein
MKATLEYKLPEETYEYMRAAQANDAWAALYEIDNMLRNLLKHGDSRYKTIEELAQAIRTEARCALDKVEE